jgi:hypothetical protein
MLYLRNQAIALRLRLYCVAIDVNNHASAAVQETALEDKSNIISKSLPQQSPPFAPTSLLHRGYSSQHLHIHFKFLPNL